jgi:tRNA (uracil-5-)-methyltransferase
MDSSSLCNFECFFCGTNKQGGNRKLSIHDLDLLRDKKIASAYASIVLPESSKVALSQEECVEQAICWSGCPTATKFFTIRTHSNLSERSAAGALPIEQPIIDGPFDLGFIKYDPEQYETILTSKRNDVMNLLTSEACVILPEVESIRSPNRHFRQRCRLGVLITSTPSSSSSIDEVDMMYLMWNEEGIPSRIVHQFPLASSMINDLLLPLKTQLLLKPLLYKHLSAIHFLTTLSGEALITLVYEGSKTTEFQDHNISQEWCNLCENVIESLLQIEISRDEGYEHEHEPTKIRALSIIGSTKGIRLVVPENATSVQEELHVKLPTINNVNSGIGTSTEDVILYYRFPFDGFSNPNAHVNSRCLEWLSQVAAYNSNGEDLLELYCGAGNHTCALSKYFPKVLCVELNKSLCICAEKNLILNNITNVKVLPMHSEKIARQLKKNKRFIWKEKKIGKSNGKGESEPESEPIEYNFGTLLVDPPRAGLDKDTRNLMNNFERVIYISCNPQSLARDLKGLCVKSVPESDPSQSHSQSQSQNENENENENETVQRLFSIKSFTVLDHFAYSVGHIESAVLLERVK